MDQWIARFRALAQASPEAVIAIVVLGALLLLSPLIVWRSRVDKRRQAQWLAENPTPLPPVTSRAIGELREIATMREDVSLTGGGFFCALLLTLTLIMAFFDYMSAKTVFQQLQAGVEAIAGTLLWGGGVALGRRRTYVIFNAPARE